MSPREIAARQRHTRKLQAIHLVAAAPRNEASTDPMVCAFALHRGRYCNLTDGHDGDHAPAPDAYEDTLVHILTPAPGGGSDLAGRPSVGPMPRARALRHLEHLADNGWNLNTLDLAYDDNGSPGRLASWALLTQIGA
jgi:hypothetical protein